MSDWKRQTRELPIDSLPKETANAIQRHVERYNLGPILSDVLICVQTNSEKVKKGLFGKAEIVQTTAMVTPRWLVWSMDQPTNQPVVLSAQLIHVTVQDYAQTPFVEMVPDSGVEVSGMFTGASEPASAFIGLDEGITGQSFWRILIKAAADAKK
jgi:hypothetical protein